MPRTGQQGYQNLGIPFAQEDHDPTWLEYPRMLLRAFTLNTTGHTVIRAKKRVMEKFVQRVDS